MARSDPRYTWDDRLGRYRDQRTGRLVPVATIVRGLDTALAAEERRAHGLAVALQEGELTPREFQVEMAEVVENVHYYSAALGAGGWGRMNPAMMASAREQSEEVLTALAGFTSDIRAGLPLDGRMMSRAKGYAQSGRATYWETNTATRGTKGMTRVRNVLDPSLSFERHCHGTGSCVEQTNLGWQPIAAGTITMPGTRLCRSNDRCELEYDDTPLTEDEEAQVAAGEVSRELRQTFESRAATAKAAARTQAARRRRKVLPKPAPAPEPDVRFVEEFVITPSAGDAFLHTELHEPLAVRPGANAGLTKAVYDRTDTLAAVLPPGRQARFTEQLADIEKDLGGFGPNTIIQADRRGQALPDGSKVTNAQRAAATRAMDLVKEFMGEVFTEGMNTDVLPTKIILRDLGGDTGAQVEPTVVDLRLAEANRKADETGIIGVVEGAPGPGETRVDYELTVNSRLASDFLNLMAGWRGTREWGVLGTVLHEGLHLKSGMAQNPDEYQSENGQVLEEAPTELFTRRLTDKMWGDAPLPADRTMFAGYRDIIPGMEVLEKARPGTMDQIFSAGFTSDRKGFLAAAVETYVDDTLIPLLTKAGADDGLLQEVAAANAAGVPSDKVDFAAFTLPRILGQIEFLKTADPSEIDPDDVTDLANTLLTKLDPGARSLDLESKESLVAARRTQRLAPAEPPLVPTVGTPIEEEPPEPTIRFEPTTGFAPPPLADWQRTPDPPELTEGENVLGRGEPFGAGVAAVDAVVAMDDYFRNNPQQQEEMTKDLAVAEARFAQLEDRRKSDDASESELLTLEDRAERDLNRVVVKWSKVLLEEMVQTQGGHLPSNLRISSQLPVDTTGSTNPQTWEVTFNQNIVADLANFLAGHRTAREWGAVETLIHEQLHVASPARSPVNYFSDGGQFTEEAFASAISRRGTDKLFGDAPLPEDRERFAGYRDFAPVIDAYEEAKPGLVDAVWSQDTAAARVRALATGFDAYWKDELVPTLAEAMAGDPNPDKRQTTDLLTEKLARLSDLDKYNITFMGMPVVLRRLAAFADDSPADRAFQARELYQYILNRM